VTLPAFDPKPSARFGLEILTEAGASFALIGKVAMWAHLPEEQHEFTKDVDFAVPPESIEPIRAALARRQIVPRELPIGGLGVRHGDLRVDFIDRRTGGLDHLYTEAIDDALKHGSEADVGGDTVPVVAPEYLVAMKIAAAEDRDEAHAVQLLHVLSDLDLGRTREILGRLGGPVAANRLDALARRAGRPDARPDYRNSG
jgi:hypothetical protein